MVKTKRNMKKFSRTVLVLLLLCSTTTLSGCLQPLQLNERALVQAIGVDWIDEQIHLTLQVFSPAAGGGSGLAASPQNANIIESSGGTVTEAFQNASLIQGKEMFIGHNRVIIVGAELARRGIDYAISYFPSSSTARHNANLAIAEGTAKEIVTAKINQGILPAATLERILENAEDSGLFEGVKLYEFMTSLQNKHDSAILPVFARKSEEEQSTPAATDGAESKDKDTKKADNVEVISPITIDGMAVFVDGKMIDTLKGSDVRGLLWLRNKISDTVITVQNESYQSAAIHIYSTKSKLTPKINNNGDSISFSLTVNCHAALKETVSRPGADTQMSIDSINALESAAENVIIAEAEAAFERTVVQDGADIFNLGNIVWKQDKNVWKTVRSNWSEHLKEIKLSVTPNIVIDRLKFS